MHVTAQGTTGKHCKPTIGVQDLDTLELGIFAAGASPERLEFVCELGRGCEWQQQAKSRPKWGDSLLCFPDLDLIGPYAFTSLASRCK